MSATTGARDEGLTLVELVITSALLSLVVAVIGGIMISLFTTERTVAAVSEGATAAQSTASAIGDQLRNASDLRVIEVEGSEDDELLVARIAGSAEELTWRCVAWYYSAAGEGEILTRTTDDGSAIATPTPDELSTWSLLLTGVEPPAGRDVFVESGDRLEVGFDASAGDSPPVAIRFTSARLTGAEESASCF